MNVDGHCTFSGSVVVVAVSSDLEDVPLRRGIVGFGKCVGLGAKNYARATIVTTAYRNCSVSVCSVLYQRKSIELRVACCGDDITR